jgi:HK97 family phage major capsid protein
MRGRINELEARMAAVRNTIETENRTMKPEEMDQLAADQAEHADLARQVKLLDGVDMARAQTSVARPAVEARPAMSLAQAGSKDSWGFKSFGHFLGDVRSFNTTGRASEGITNAIRMAASTYQSEGTSADGGVLVPTEFRRDIASYVLGQESLLGQTDQYNSFSTTLVFPFDEVQSFTGSVAFARTSEAGTIGEVKGALSTRTVVAYKAATIVSLTDELVEDSPAASAYVTKKVADKLTNNINYELIWGAGTGSSQALGFMSCSCLKTVASASGQGAGTLVAKNISDMYYGMPQQDRSTAVWLVSPALEPQLPNLVISGTTIPIYQPPGGLSQSPFGTIMGRPYISMWHMKAAGTVGDIAFVNLKRYLTLLKGPMRTDFTIAAYFNQGLQSYRFQIRWGGTPWPSQVVTLPSGATLSPFVTLAAR